MKTLARLSFQVSAGEMAEFEAAYEKELAPLLRRHGLEATSTEGGAAVAGRFGRIFELDAPAACHAVRRAILRDPAVKQVVVRLEAMCEPGGDPGDSIFWGLGLHRAPAGAGRSVRAGDGIRQGVWQSFDVTDGLPAPIISSLLQDRQGHLWFGTWGGGICQYDGTCFTIFSEEDGLPSGAVKYMLEDRRGHLWIGTHHRGVCRYDGQVFETFTAADGLAHNSVGSVLEDSRGQLWFATAGGVSRYDGTRFETFGHEEGLVSDRGVASILEDRRGSLWFATEDGLSRYDGIRFTVFTEEGGLPDVEGLSSMLEDRDGNLWIGTGGGVSCYDGTEFHNLSVADGLPDDRVTAVLQDREGQMWFATSHGGACRYDGGRLETFTQKQGLAFDDVKSILEDREGDVWFATAGGVSRYAGTHFRTFTSEDGLAENDVMAILEDRRGRLWFGTEGGWTRGGVSRYDGVEFKTLTSDDGLPFNRVSSITEDREGNLWFGTIGGGGVSRYDGTRFENFGTEEGLAEDTVWCVAADRHGQIWCGTNGGGVSRYDGTGFSTFTTEDGLAGDAVRAILEDRRGHLWFATIGGVSRYDGETFETFSADDGLPDDIVWSILEDRQGHIWFVTHESLCRYDGRAFTTFSPEDWPAGTGSEPAFVPEEGATINGVGPILQDERGHIWFGNLRTGGLSRFDGFVFQTLVPRDGLANNRVRDLFQARGGDVWIATTGGVTRYRSRRTPPSITLADVVTDRHHGPVAEIEVSTAQSLLAFEFTGQSFKTRAGQMVYAYRLQGHDEAWQQTRATRAEYQDLPVGEYTFQVRAIDRDLNYSEPAAVAVTVGPDPGLEAWKAALDATGTTGEFAGESKALQRVQLRLLEVAPTDLTVLILGETGTGKGLAARTLHDLSSRREGPLIPVNCGALPENLVESELFGHERGAFTGAVGRKLGKVELAAAGTLFLDEIGDLAAAAQAKLLRLLEERTFERVGGTRTLSAEVRVIAATNRDLEQMVRDGEYREDLYFRLQPFPVQLPPLRERRDDIPLLAAQFAQDMATHLGKEIAGIHPEALEALIAYDWPGNVRELEHVVKRAVVLCRGTTIQPTEFGLVAGDGTESPAGPLVPLAENERRYILEALEQTGWVIKGNRGAAAILDLPVSTLRSRMKRLGIVRP